MKAPFSFLSSQQRFFESESVPAAIPALCNSDPFNEIRPRHRYDVLAARAFEFPGKIHISHQTYSCTASASDVPVSLSMALPFMFSLPGAK